MRIGGPRPPPGGLTCALRSAPEARRRLSGTVADCADAGVGLRQLGPRGGRVNPSMRSWALLVEPGLLCPAATRWVNVRIGGPRQPLGGLTCAPRDATERAPGARFEAGPERAHKAARSRPRSAAHNAPPLPQGRFSKRFTCCNSCSVFLTPLFPPTCGHRYIGGTMPV